MINFKSALFIRIVLETLSAAQIITFGNNTNKILLWRELKEIFV